MYKSHNYIEESLRALGKVHGLWKEKRLPGDMYKFRRPVTKYSVKGKLLTLELEEVVR